jgi:hypothetical protein
MRNDEKNPSAKSRIPSVDETTARIEKELTEQGAKTHEALPKSGESNVLETSMQSSSSVVEQTIGNLPKDPAVGSDGRPLH